MYAQIVLVNAFLTSGLWIPIMNIIQKGSVTDPFQFGNPDPDG